MRKFLLLGVFLLTAWNLSAQNQKVFLHAGFLFPRTLHGVVGFEHPLAYGNAVELFGEIGNHWQFPTCHRFWKGYYWDGGLAYKQRLVRFKNGMLRLRLGAQFGAVKQRFFLGFEGGFEYAYVFRNSWEFVITQKNTVNFLHGDTFRNGLLVGIKVPVN